MIAHYPSITREEFEQACTYIETQHAATSAMCDWTSVKWMGEDLQIRQRRTQVIIEDQLGDQVADPDVIEDDDPESLVRPSKSSSPFDVDFSVVLSLTYQVPVLWFSLPNSVSTSFPLDRVYELVVSPSSREGLRQIGVLGGISIAHHPVSDIPAFFIHPCQTQEALQAVQPDGDIGPGEYLMLWLGIIGSAVGLAMPARLATACPLLSRPALSDECTRVNVHHNTQDSQS